MSRIERNSGSFKTHKSSGSRGNVKSSSQEQTGKVTANVKQLIQLYENNNQSQAQIEAGANTPKKAEEADTPLMIQSEDQVEAGANTPKEAEAADAKAESNAAATKLQAQVRGNKEKTKFAGKKEAATKIQSFVRGKQNAKYIVQTHINELNQKKTEIKEKIKLAEQNIKLAEKKETPKDKNPSIKWTTNPLVPKDTGGSEEEKDSKIQRKEQKKAKKAQKKEIKAQKKVIKAQKEKIKALDKEIESMNQAILKNDTTAIKGEKERIKKQKTMHETQKTILRDVCKDLKLEDTAIEEILRNYDPSVTKKGNVGNGRKLIEQALEAKIENEVKQKMKGEDAKILNKEVKEKNGSI